MPSGTGHIQTDGTTTDQDEPDGAPPPPPPPAALGRRRSEGSTETESSLTLLSCNERSWLRQGLGTNSSVRVDPDGTVCPLSTRHSRKRR